MIRPNPCKGVKKGCGKPSAFRNAANPVLSVAILDQELVRITMSASFQFATRWLGGKAPQTAVGSGRIDVISASLDTTKKTVDVASGTSAGGSNEL